MSVYRLKDGALAYYAPADTDEFVGAIKLHIAERDTPKWRELSALHPPPADAELEAWVERMRAEDGAPDE